MPPTFYIDPESGSDAAAGTSFATAWQTIVTGATAARIAPGDTIRIKASPAPSSIGSATWTNLSKTITLAGALTADIDLCESGWTASANVTATASGTCKQGSGSSSIAIAAGFTTGLAAYKTIASTDYSGYQQVSFWMRTNIAGPITAGQLQLLLCSDTAGATPVNTINIPQTAGTNIWHPITIDTGGALGAAIQSVALNVTADFGAVTVLLDNIIACKASSSADSLSLTSLIGKNTATEGWWNIQSINGTTVLLDLINSSGASAGRGYYGTTESVTTYKRETFKITAQNNVNLGMNSAQESGTSDSVRITYSGGWNRTDMSTQTDYSFFDAQNGLGTIVDTPSIDFITIEKCGWVRGNQAILNGRGCIFDDCHFVGNTANNVSMSGVGNKLTDSFLTSGGVGITTTAYNQIVDNCKILSASTPGMLVQRSFYGRDLTIGNVGGIGMTMGAGNARPEFVNCVFDQNATSDLFSHGGFAYFNRCQFLSTTEASAAPDYADSRIFSSNHDGSDGTHKIIMDGATVASDSGADRRTASGIAWKVSPTSTTRTANYPVQLSLANIACEANSLVTVKVWVKRSNTGLTASLICKGDQISGVGSDVVSSAAGSAGTYEQLTITFTPSAAGVVEIVAECYGGTTYSAWFDDMEISQA
jgi:hypothetical protein